MFRKLTVLTLAAALLIGSASPAFAQRGGRGGMGGGGRGAVGVGRGVGVGGGYRGGYYGGYRNYNNNWNGFGTGLAIGVGVGALGSGYYNGGYGYGGYGYSSPSYYYADPGYTYSVPNTSFYSGPADAGNAASVPMNRNTALINIHVPPGAQVFFGDTPATSSQTGMDRQFMSPPLEPGSNYQYDLRAVWNENGQTINRTRTVAVHANDVVNVDFTRTN